MAISVVNQYFWIWQFLQISYMGECDYIIAGNTIYVNPSTSLLVAILVVLLGFIDCERVK